MPGFDPNDDGTSLGPHRSRDCDIDDDENKPEPPSTSTKGYTPPGEVSNAGRDAPVSNGKGHTSLGTSSTCPAIYIHATSILTRQETEAAQYFRNLVEQAWACTHATMDQVRKLAQSILRRSFLPADKLDVRGFIGSEITVAFHVSSDRWATFLEHVKRTEDDDPQIQDRWAEGDGICLDVVIEAQRRLNISTGSWWRTILPVALRAPQRLWIKQARKTAKRKEWANPWCFMSLILRHAICLRRQDSASVIEWLISRSDGGEACCGVDGLLPLPDKSGVSDPLQLTVLGALDHIVNSNAFQQDADLKDALTHSPGPRGFEGIPAFPGRQRVKR